MNNFYKENFIADVSSIDYSAKLNLVDVMKQFQLLATLHAYEMGMDYFTLKEKDNAFWVLSKVKLAFLEGRPKWGDEYSMETTPHSPTNVKFLRSFKIRNKSGAVSAKGSSEWCILDADSRRIRRSTTVSSYPNDFDYIESDGWDEDFKRIDETAITSDDLCYVKEVFVSDIDMNMHMNNVVYTKVVMDCFTSEELAGKEYKNYELHFIREVSEGQKIDVFKKEIDNIYVIIGKIQESGQTCFKAVLELI